MTEGDDETKCEPEACRIDPLSRSTSIGLSDPRRMDLLAEHLDQIRRIAREVCARHGLDDEDAEDFHHDVILHVKRNDVLGKYAGGSLAAYLRRVIQNLFFDTVSRERGRWRPSAQAKRLGPVAVLLDTLINRDGYPRDEAIEIVSSRADVHMSLDDIAALARSIPVRDGRPARSSVPVDNQPSGDTADVRVNEGEREQTATKARGVLRDALASLPDEDRVLIVLRYQEGLMISEIARNLHLDQRKLYGRVNGIRSRLLGELKSRGVTRDDIVELFDGS